MLLKGVFKKTNYISLDGAQEASNAPSVPDGLFTMCDSCGSSVFTDELDSNLRVCPKCGHHFRMDARTRIASLVDEGTFTEWDNGLTSKNPLDYPGYIDKIEKLKENTELDEAVITGRGRIGGNDCVIGVCDTRFLMGSMGEVVGEKITRAVENATKEKLPVILFTCSGGARMQEGIVSLMQMAKTSAALKKHDEAGLLYITVLTDPTTGGVTASFAMLGDIILAEPGALVGFAGPRVIKQTIGQDLPKGFQRSEFLLEHGLIDNIVTRGKMKETLSKLLSMHKRPEDDKMQEYKAYLDEVYARSTGNKQEETEVNPKDAWDCVLAARDKERPVALDYIYNITKDFYELHGDRAYKDDMAIIGGIAMFGKLPVTVIGQQKGKTTRENMLHNFGMPYPEGYRKARRLMKQAEKFKRPIICLVDTPGAYCGIGAEERGQGEAIARNLYEMSDLKVPVLSIVIGEGGSGGALALAVANEVWMLENSIYSILSPEGFASILWKDAKKAPEAAQVMKITASDLKELGVIDRVIPEFPVITEKNIRRVTYYMKRKIADFMLKYNRLSGDELAAQRFEKFRNM
ncbi:MAG: acetyl-CoA carboxylase, carboxyltransferase subunit beta [Clostridia bacterium]|nr:acetyl-CoA carboxylase, carboxyltransferase subunit beta [Clostridia bacterium]